MTVFTIKSRADAFSVASNSSLILLKVVAGLLTGRVTGFSGLASFTA